MLVDESFSPAPNVALRQFSAEHLLWQNSARELDPLEIANRLAYTAEKAKETQYSHLAAALARRLKSRFSQLNDDITSDPSSLTAANEFDAFTDHKIVEAAIKIGRGIGLSSPWGRSSEADLLWAGAAMIVRSCGYEHPNEMV